MNRLENEVNAVIAHAQGKLKTVLPKSIQFDLRQEAPRDVLTDEERAQSVSFFTRYEQLPKDPTVSIVQDGTTFRIGNMAFLRHALNDWRPLIQLEKDPVFYQNMFRVWYPMLLRKNPRDGLCIKVIDEGEKDVTPTFARWMAERNKAITAVLRPLEFGYLYNGMLQHSLPIHAKRFFQDYVSGELNYILWKHVMVLDFIRELLKPMRVLVGLLTFPTLGPL